MIKKIRTITSYKSFLSFSWDKFCKNSTGQEESFQKLTVIFGENGSGKSSICDILKSLSQASDFDTAVPHLAEIETKNGGNEHTFKYENGKWTSHVNKNSFLFFDVDFVNANVHTHGMVSSNLQQGAHTQKAGKLIIDLDEQANSLKGLVETKRQDLESFKKENSDIDLPPDFRT